MLKKKKEEEEEEKDKEKKGQNLVLWLIKRLGGEFVV